MSLFKRYPAYKFILAYLDFSAFAIVFFIALKIRFRPYIDLLNNPDHFIHPVYWVFLVHSFFCLFIFQYLNLYKKHVFISFFQQQKQIFKAVSISILGFVIVSFLVKKPMYFTDSRLVIGYSTVGLLVVVSFLRIAVFRTVFLLFARKDFNLRRILIVGAGESGRKVATKILNDKRYGLEFVGFADDFLERGTRVFQSYIVLGDTGEIRDLVKIYNAHEIIISLSNITYEELKKIVEKCKGTDRIVQIYSDLYGIVPLKVDVEHYTDLPMITMGKFDDEGIHHILKRMIDVFLTMIGVILLLPLFVLIGITIKLDSKGPVFFKQTRLGKNGKPFTFYKFRSMYVDVDDKIHRDHFKHIFRNSKNGDEGNKEQVYKIVNDPRVTRVGSFLRRTSLDELPQLFNILKGEMSIVGPRPCLSYEYEEYSSWHKERLKVLPGLTGLWQIAGRSSVTFDDMVILDLYYIENMSPWFDAQIILKTIPTVLFGQGAH